MTRAAVIARAEHQRHWCGAVAAGLKRHGVDVVAADLATLAGADFAVCWGWHIGQRIRATGLPVLVLERGYVGDRFAWASAGWNGLNGRARFPEIEDGGARWRSHFKRTMRDWRVGTGDLVVIMGQVPGDCAVQGVDIAGWYADTAADLAPAAAFAGVEVRFRPHPVAVERGQVRPVPGAERIDGTLAEVLAAARWVVTWNSNTAVDAVLAGVPAVSCDRGSMAWDVTGHDRTLAPPAPNRNAWAARMAWRQWTEQELASGEAWDHLKGVDHADC